MEHWAYLTDDDEPPKKETSSAASTLQHPAANERRNADVPNPAERDERPGTSAQGGQSWPRIEPHPENARPPPYLDPPKQQLPSAPAPWNWTPEMGDEAYRHQDPSLPPGVIDISEELRWRHRQRQRQSEWANELLVRSGILSAGPTRRPERHNEASPWYAAREETTRNQTRKAHGPPYALRMTDMRPTERPASWHAPWHCGGSPALNTPPTAWRAPTWGAPVTAEGGGPVATPERGDPTRV